MKLSIHRSLQPEHRLTQVAWPEVKARWQNLAERAPLATVGDQLANTQKKTWEMVMNPDVDGYTKTLNHGKIFPKLQKSDNLLKTKRMKKKV